MTKYPGQKKENSPSTDLRADEELSKLIEREIGEIVPKKQREVIVSRMTSIMVSEHFSGPLPHPRHLSAYETISPGSAERIIGMAEKQQEHHMSMDRKVLGAEILDRKLGMWLGAIAFVFLITCALISALWTESEIIPGLFLTAAALGGVGLFVKGRGNGA